MARSARSATPAPFAQIAEGSKLTFVPDGPGEYVVRVDAVGSCVGQVASSEASLRVDCNRAPVPDAVVFEEDDVVLALETPRHDDDDDAMLAPPNANKTDFLVSGGAFSGAFSALDAGARVATPARACLMVKAVAVAAISITIGAIATRGIIIETL